MNASLDHLYFDWLYRQVCPVDEGNRSKTYWELLYIFFTKEVVWFVPNDDNRLEDGRDLRREFLRDEGYSQRSVDWLWMDLGCSFLEFLIGIARRAAFETDSDQVYWFWKLLENIGLDGLDDRKRIKREKVEDVLNRVIWRTYDYDGTGGLFPLEDPVEDQRKVEIWYQLNTYIIERSYI